MPSILGDDLVDQALGTSRGSARTYSAPRTPPHGSILGDLTDDAIADVSDESSAPLMDYFRNAYGKASEFVGAPKEALDTLAGMGSEYLEGRGIKTGIDPRQGNEAGQILRKINPLLTLNDTLVNGASEYLPESVGKVVRGANEGLVDKATALATDPAMALVPESRLAAAAFLPGIASSASHEYGAAKEAYAQGEYGEAARHGAGALVDTAFGALGLGHALGGHGVAETAPETGTVEPKTGTLKRPEFVEGAQVAPDLPPGPELGYGRGGVPVERPASPTATASAPASILSPDLVDAAIDEVAPQTTISAPDVVPPVQTETRSPGEDVGVQAQPVVVPDAATQPVVDPYADLLGRLPESDRAIVEAAHYKARTSDPLTGLKNKYGWQDLVKTVGPEDHAIVADLKGFKAINDVHGHAVGDAFLARVGQLFGQHFGEDAARFGGDEFGAVLRGLSPEDAQARADAFSRDLSALTHKVQMPDGSVLDIPGLEAHIGLAKDAEAADLASNAARVANGSGRRSTDVPANVEGVVPSEPGAPGSAGGGRENPPAVASAVTETPPVSRPAEQPIAPEGVPQKKWDRYLKARLREVDNDAAENLKRKFRAKYGEGYSQKSLTKEERSELAKARTDWSRVPNPPKDSAGNPIIPGQEDWTPQERSAARAHADQVLREIEAKGKAQPVSRRGVVDVRGAGSGDMTGEGYSVTSHKEGTAFEGLPYEPKEMRAALKADKGNPIEQDVLEAAGRDYQAQAEEFGDATFDPAQFEGDSKYAVTQKTKAGEQVVMPGTLGMNENVKIKTEGREGEGPLFKQDEAARLKAEKESQGRLFSVGDLSVTETPEQYRVRDPSGRTVVVGKGTVGSEAEAREYAARYFSKQPPAKSARFVASVNTDHVNSAFPTGRVTFDKGEWRVELPGNRNIRISPRGEIAYTLESLKAGHPEAFDAAGNLNEHTRVMGSWRKVGRDGIIELAKIGGNEQVLGHESFHAAMDLALTPKERAAVLKHYGDEETAADAYAKWNPRETSHSFFGKIRDFFRNIYRSFRPSWESAFEATRSGKAFERGADVVAAEPKYATAPKTPPQMPERKLKPIPNRPETVKAGGKNSPEAMESLGERVTPGEPPRVETKVASLKEVSPDVKLSRDAPRTWKSLDPEIRTKLEDIAEKPEKELALYERARTGRLNDVEVQTLDALVAGKRESYDTVRTRLLKAQAEGRDTGPENTAYLSAALDKAASELAVAARSDVEAGTKLARALAARARVMEAAGKSTPDHFLRKVFRQIEGVTDEQAKGLLQIMQERPQDLGDALIAATKPTTLDKFLEAWKNGLVSAPGTLIGANPIGNIGEQLVRLGETGAASFLDPLLGGPSTRLRGEAGFEFGGAMKGVSKSLGQLGKDLRDIVALAPERIDLDHLDRVPAIGGKIGRAVRAPYRLLSVVDDFFKGVGGEAELHKLAWREAKGNRAEALKLIADPPKAMLEAVNKSRLDRTFQNPDKLVSNLVQLRSQHKWLHIIAPFLQTPTNIAKLAWQRSPAGFYEGFKAWREWKEATPGTPEAARLKGVAVDKLARPLVGTAIMGAFYAVAKSGGMTGSGPTDAKDRNALKDSGWQPYSFVIPTDNGKHLFIPFNRFEPVSTLLGIAADAAEAKDAKTTGDLIDKGLGSVIENFTSKTYLSGLSDAANAISDPKQFASQYASGLAGSLVPNIVNKAAQEIDPVVRDTKAGSAGITGIPERIAKTIASRIPGATFSLTAKKGSLGEDVVRPGNAWTRFLSPIQPTEEKESAGITRTLIDIDAVPSVPKRELTIPNSKGKKVRLTDSEYAVLTDAAKQATESLRRVTNSGQFKRLDAEEQRSYVRRVYDRAETAARQKLMRQQSVRDRARQIIRGDA